VSLSAGKGGERQRNQFNFQPLPLLLEGFCFVRVVGDEGGGVEGDQTNSRVMSVAYLNSQPTHNSHGTKIVSGVLHLEVAIELCFVNIYDV
jgi:hypothetical protein